MWNAFPLCLCCCDNLVYFWLNIVLIVISLLSHAIVTCLKSSLIVMSPEPSMIIVPIELILVVIVGVLRMGVVTLKSVFAMIIEIVVGFVEFEVFA